MVTAVAAERDAVLAGRHPAAGTVAGLPVHRALTPAGLVDAVSGGVGPVAAAVSTGRLLGQGYDLVLSAGIAGGFPTAPVTSLVVADAVVHADLGAETADGFTSMAELGWGEVRHRPDPALVAEVRRRTGALAGAVLTVSTVTGSRQRAEQLLAAHPDAVAEAMEGIGCYLAAAAAGVPFVELRAVANPVGPRQRESWRIADALNALSAGFADLLAQPLPALLAQPLPNPPATTPDTPPAGQSRSGALR